MNGHTEVCVGCGVTFGRGVTDRLCPRCLARREQAGRVATRFLKLWRAVAVAVLCLGAVTMLVCLAAIVCSDTPVDVTVGGRPVGKGVGCVVLAGFLVVWLAVGAVVLRLGGTALHRVIEGAIQRAGDTGPPRPRQR